MRIDLYTKTVLTVIAGALLMLCVQNTVSPRRVLAQGIQRVMIVGAAGEYPPVFPLRVTLVSSDGSPISVLPVYVSNSKPIAVVNANDANK